VADSSGSSSNNSVGRREFFKGAALGAASLVVTSRAMETEAAPEPPRPGVLLPTEAQAQAEAGATPPSVEAVRQPASDFMVDVLRKLDLDYAAINPGSAFAGLHESILSYAGNRKPELLTCLHEEAAIAMAHGYAKAAGKPMLVCVHGTVGLLHGSMALFQAWADRVPVVLIVGMQREPTGVVNLPHSAQDLGVIVRDFVKFDDQTTTLQRFAESAMRGYQLAMTPPRGPVMLVVPTELQEEEIAGRDRPRIPELARVTAPQGDLNALREVAGLLVNAETPIILPRKVARSQQGWDRMIELGELLQCPVDPGGYGSWQNFPTWHPLWGNGGPQYQADVTLGLEMSDMSNLARAARASGRKTISISSEHLFQHSNIHDYGRYADVDLAIGGDAEASLPLLIEEARKLITPDKRRAFAARGTRVAAAHKEAHAQFIENARYGWESSPVSVPRMIAELGDQIKNDDWALVSGSQFTIEWQRRLMNFDKPYRYNGDNGGFGVGYDTPASMGAALAHKQMGRLSVAIVGDGDLNFSPGSLWTVAHHQIPLLYVVHNNRAYHAEVMIVQRMCGHRGRGSGNAHIGTTISNPNISYAQMAKAYGLYSEGPVDHPKDLAGAYRRALERVRQGEPALVEVVAQPR
jgi:acetolactate synthase-1/2/3 large subunit